MPTIFSHAVVAAAAGQWFPSRGASNPESRIPNPGRFWVWTAICSMLPDIDVISFAFGIRYEDMFGHRGFTHSIFFAVLIGLVAAVKTRQAPPHLGVGSRELGVLWIWFTTVTASHGVLDAFTNGGRGIAFFAPFSNHRYFFPWRPIQVSPIGAGFFSPRGLRVLASESLWIWAPSAIMAASAAIFRRRT